MEKIINFSTMLKYVQNFDGVCAKYSLSSDDKNNYTDVYDKCRRQEIYMHLPEKHRDYAITIENLEMIYGDNNSQNHQNAHDMIALYNHVRNNVISKFINIEGIDQLYTDHYFDFEWVMHTNMKLEKGERDFYRDHFIHQVRVFYEMMTFLDDEENNYPILREALEVVHNKNNSIVLNYMDDAVRKELLSLTQAQKDAYLGLYKCITSDDPISPASNKNYLGIYSANDLKVDQTSTNHEVKQENIENDILYTLLFNYFMRLSCTMSALFHDIGYPICHNAQQNKRLSAYISRLYTSNEAVGNFKRITSLLETSLLFKCVDKDEIEKRLDDHGVMSALTFLLHFYENGSISGVTPIQRAAIEIAALAIYDHHIQYACVEKKSDNYYRPYFKKNPVAFILRMCDDMQEWNRVYFDYQYSSSMMICPICHTPTLNRLLKNAHDIRTYERVCLCTRDKQYDNNVPNCYHLVPVDFGKYHTQYTKLSTIRTQKVSIIETCKELEIEWNDTSPRKSYNISIKYEPFQLLQMSYVSSAFSKFRANDLKNLKSLLDAQFESFDVKLDYFITTNPVLLKYKILEQFFNQCFEKTYEKTYDERKDTIDELIDEIYKSNLWYGNDNDYKNVLENLKNHVKRNTEVYLKILGYTNNSFDWNNVKAGLFISEPLSVILDDAKYQLDCLEKRNNPKEYEKLFIYADKSKEDYYYDMITAYCDVNVSPNVWRSDILYTSKKDKYHYLDMYTDLLLYRALNELIKFSAFINNNDINKISFMDETTAVDCTKKLYLLSCGQSQDKCDEIAKKIAYLHQLYTENDIIASYVDKPKK